MEESIMYELIGYFITAVVIFAIGGYVWAVYNPDRAPKQAIPVMMVLAIFGIVALMFWGTVPPPTP